MLFELYWVCCATYTTSSLSLDSRLWLISSCLFFLESKSRKHCEKSITPRSLFKSSVEPSQLSQWVYHFLSHSLQTCWPAQHNELERKEQIKSWAETSVRDSRLTWNAVDWQTTNRILSVKWHVSCSRMIFHLIHDILRCHFTTN